MASLRRLVLPHFTALPSAIAIRLCCSRMTATRKRSPGRASASDEMRLHQGAGVDLRHWVHAPEGEGRPLSSWHPDCLCRRCVGLSRRRAGSMVMDSAPRSGCRADNANGHSVDEAVLGAWHDSRVIRYLGHRGDLHELMGQVHVVCLPSYYGEGVPKVLLEAAASGRPIVTTDMPGCRDAIDESASGFLVPPRDIDALVERLTELIDSPEKRWEMGMAARRKAEREFGLDVVIDRHLELYNSLLAGRFSTAER